MSFTKKNRNRPGFTMIELLVVVAIIGVLLAILVPSLAHVLDRGRHSGCLSNTKQIVMAVNAFAYDHDGYLPAPGWGFKPHPTWLYTDYQMTNPEDVKTGQIWPYLNTMDVYRCPADSPADPKVIQRINRVKSCYNLSSYCMNGSVIAYEDERGAYKPEILIDGNGNTYRVTISIEHFNADDIVLWEADQRITQGGMWHDGSNRPDEGMTDRHRTWGSVGCFDGHAEKMENDEFYLRQAPHNIGRTRLWNVPAVYSSSGH